MRYAKIFEGIVEKYPYTLRDFKMEHPDISPPNDMSALSDWGITPVVQIETAPPTLEIEKAVKGPVTLVDGVWTETWEIMDVTAEIEAKKDASALRQADQVQFRILFQHENRIRVLEGKNPITKAAFITAIRSML